MAIGVRAMSTKRATDGTVRAWHRRKGMMSSMRGEWIENFAIDNRILDGRSIA
jgi:hypothetical protein